MVTQVLTREDVAPGDGVLGPTADGGGIGPHPNGRGNGQDLPPRVVDTLAGVFAALGEPARLRIVHALSRGELCVGDLATTLGMAVPAVSQHLRVLRDLRIVRNRRAGKSIYYALDDSHVSDLFHLALAHVQGGED